RIQPGYFVPSGRDYLLWSMSEFGRPNTERYRPARKYIDSGSQFNVILRLRSSSDERIIYKAIAAFWLVANLGALGSRARRGAGSIKVVIPASNTPIPFKICRSIEELREYLSSGIKECLKLVGGEGLYFDRPPKYDTLAPGAAEVWIVSDSANGWQTPEEALEGIGSKLRDFRSYRSKIGKSDHDAILKWLSERDAPPRIKRAVFGLPLPFRYSEGGPSDVIVAKGVERRASPLHIRITQIETGYVGVLTLFKSQFLEKGTNLQLKMREWEAPPPTSYSVIQDFIQSFHNKREVNL
ncbi:MAG: hypothetical protein RMM07_13370, partial [Anaerolineae bacterium]|nr:hypothetical protein [Anaerolineae bacterium]